MPIPNLSGAAAVFILMLTPLFTPGVPSSISSSKTGQFCVIQQQLKFAQVAVCMILWNEKDKI